ncbi:MAG: ribosome silencing factor [SAR202 cluster bacterium]|jgi:ribosome-associated protein|nr:ribosome silencing factor [SAR202 cluster bacterium]
MRKPSQIKSENLARLVVDVASDKQASDIVLLDINGLSDFADYFVITTVETKRQMKSLTEDIETEMERCGATLYHKEGIDAGGWVLLDFGDVVVHMFGLEERDYFGIEEVWDQGVEAVRIQ